jgi:hypothetical protein
MSHDPIVDEIHRIRKQIMDECGNDPRQYFARLKAAEAKHENRLVSRLPPKQGTRSRP